MAAADKLRGNMDAAEYKHVALGLIFLKYISDRFEERRARALADPEEGAAGRRARPLHRRQRPLGARQGAVGFHQGERHQRRTDDRPIARRGHVSAS